MTAPGYERRAHHLQAVTLRRGLLDMPADAPRWDLHPAIHGLLLQTARDAFSGGETLSPPDQFPNRFAEDLPVSDEPVRFHERRPSTLRGSLRFWAATLVERAWMVIKPVLALASPLVRSATPVYRWRIRRKIYLWYRDPRQLEAQGCAAGDEASMRLVQDKLNALEREVRAIPAPEDYTEEPFSLREHIAFVRHGLQRVPVAA